MVTSRVLAGCCVTALVALMMGLLIGHYGIKEKSHNDVKLNMLDQMTVPKYHPGDDVVQHILREAHEENIRENLRLLSEKPHIAGTERDNYLANYIKDRWERDGLDEVKFAKYSVLLSYPTEKINQVSIVDQNGSAVFTAAAKEKIVQEGDIFAYAFNGFSPPGDVTAQPVYVSYGRLEDFDELEKYGINVSGKICIARYGKIFRGNKVKNAEDRGAVGVILFLDPAQVAIEGTDQYNVYPHKWWMPGDAMQRGTVYIGNGDPLTPGYPSTENAYRYSQDEVQLPRIPSQPIGYDDAREILRNLSGPSAPVSFHGGLEIEYHLGPGFNSENAEKMVRLVVNNKYEEKLSANVIGSIKGEIEPDRYVLIGNHRDAWGYGAVDASSGTAQLLEVTRIFGNLHKKGWKPRRTLLFCSWGAEEYGIIGSTEWVEEHIHELSSRSVGYVNVDICTSGNYFSPSASPILAQALKAAAEQVNDPTKKESNLLKRWKAQLGRSSMPDSNLSVRTLGSGSDHAPFSFYGGIPAIDITWGLDKKLYNISGYPPYHTAYEPFEIMKFIDHDFAIHKGCAEISSALLHMLSNSIIIPYNLVDLASKLEEAIDGLERGETFSKLRQMNIKLDYLKESIKLFRSIAEQWHKKLEDIDTSNPLIVRQVNDMMMMVERIFVKPDGLPYRPFTRHVAFAPSQYDLYSSKGFPGVTDLLYGVNKMSSEEQEARKKELMRHVSDLAIIIGMATKFINTTTHM